MHRVGYHFPTEVVSLVCAQYGIRLDNRGRVIKEHGQNDDNFMRLQINGEVILNEKIRDQVDINTEAKEIITDLFPRIPDKDMFQIIKTAFQLGTGKVGTADEIPLVRRAQLSVVAHIRHVYTDYDRLIRRIPYNEARHKVEEPTLGKLVEWSADEGASEEDRRRAEELFREVIVLSDDDASDSEGDDAEHVVQDDLRVEELPVNAYAPAPLRARSPQSSYLQEEVADGIRIVEAPMYRYPAREIDVAARDRDRFAKWERARQQYRLAPVSAAPRYERIYEPPSDRQLIPLEPQGGRVIERQYLGTSDARPVDHHQVGCPHARDLSAPYYVLSLSALRSLHMQVQSIRRSPPRSEIRYIPQPQYDRVVTQPDPLPASSRQIRYDAPPSYSQPSSRPLTPKTRPKRLSRRTPSLNGGDGSILPSIEAPDAPWPPSSGTRQRPDRPNEIIDLARSIEQTSRHRRMKESDVRRVNPFERDNGAPRYDPRERSPRRSPLLAGQRRIIETEDPHSDRNVEGPRSDRQYREVREADYPTSRRIIVPEDDPGNYQHSNPFGYSQPVSYTRILEPLSPTPREPPARRALYVDDRPAVEYVGPSRIVEGGTRQQTREQLSYSDAMPPVSNQAAYYQNQQGHPGRQVIYSARSRNDL